MNLKLNVSLANGYKSNSQIVRLLTENWVLNNSYCPSCGISPLNEFENNRPVADFLPTISIKAKDLAAEMTGLNVQSKDLTGQSKIEKEHIDNNSAVRDMLNKRGIIPENLPTAEEMG